jgi:hypothetical protein
MAALWDELEAERLARMTHNARNLSRAGHLRTGLTVKQAAEVMWAYTSPELYERLVVKQRWPIERFGSFVADGLIAALLPAAN